MSSEDLKPKIGKPTEIDKAILWSRNKPLSAEELTGFGRAKPSLPSTYPFINISMPNKEDGPKGKSIEIGIKGTF